MGTGSIALQEIPPYTVAVGAPARPVKVRFTDDELREHLRLLGREPSDINGMLERRRSGLRAWGLESLLGQNT